MSKQTLYNLSLPLSEETSLLSASLASVDSFNSFWSLRRAAVARWDSSSVSSTCIFSCLALIFAFSTCKILTLVRGIWKMNSILSISYSLYLIFKLLCLFSFIFYLSGQFFQSLILLPHGPGNCLSLSSTRIQLVRCESALTTILKLSKPSSPALMVQLVLHLM